MEEPYYPRRVPERVPKYLRDDHPKGRWLISFDERTALKKSDAMLEDLAKGRVERRPRRMAKRRRKRGRRERGKRGGDSSSGGSGVGGEGGKGRNGDHPPFGLNPADQNESIRKLDAALQRHNTLLQVRMSQRVGENIAALRLEGGNDDDDDDDDDDDTATLDTAKTMSRTMIMRMLRDGSIKRMFRQSKEDNVLEVFHTLDHRFLPITADNQQAADVNFVNKAWDPNNSYWENVTDLDDAADLLDDLDVRKVTERKKYIKMKGMLLKACPWMRTHFDFIEGKYQLAHGRGPISAEDFSEIGNILHTRYTEHLGGEATPASKMRKAYVSQRTNDEPVADMSRRTMQQVNDRRP